MPAGDAPSALFQPLTLPNGSVLPNRLCKASMEENLADDGQLPGARLQTLYRRWAEGGAGLILTGNVMVAPDALTGPGGVVLEEGVDLTPFRAWAEAGRSGGGRFWMQINHPGRQVYAAMKEQPVSASAVPMDIPGFNALFDAPRALEVDEIRSIIERFAATAALAEAAGFDGVEIHAAHGYLISQFLSPLTNRRSDEWGGSLENRARLLIEVVKAVRGRVSPGFGVGVKLNSADFQKGGFDERDAAEIVARLGETPVDLVELSGGSYESPAMQGRAGEGSSARREAYFVDFAKEIARHATMPIMVTGGVRRLSVAEAALAADAAGFGVSVLGMARAFAFAPDVARDWREGRSPEIEIPEISWRSKPLASLATMAVTKAQLKRLAEGRPPRPGISPLLAILGDRIATARQTRRYRRWREGRAG